MNSSFEQTIERLAIDADIRDLAARFSDAVISSADLGGRSIPRPDDLA